MFITILLIAACLYFTITDLKNRIIPNRVTHPVLLILFVWRLVTMEPSFLLALLPAVVYFIMFFVQPSLIGAGDIKLIAIIGLCVGLPQTLMVVGLSALGSLLMLIYLKMQRGVFEKGIPLAPYLTFGLIVTQLAIWTDMVTI